MTALQTLTVKNFRSLRDVQVTLGPLNVLVGPNAAGKSSLLEAIGFLGDMARVDLLPAVDAHGGMETLLFRGKAAKAKQFSIGVGARITKHSSAAAIDEYELTVERPTKGLLVRGESFRFKRTAGRGRRITVSGASAEFQDERSPTGPRLQSISAQSAALSTLPRLGDDGGGPQVRQMAELFTTFYVYDPDVAAARRPSAVVQDSRLMRDARNLAP